jgi:hypothetical protein
LRAPSPAFVAATLALVQEDGVLALESILEK